MQPPHRFAIIAEYRGAALMEKAGTKRVVWQGTEYFTDGRIYIAHKVPNDTEQMGIWSFEKERDAKNFIDKLLDHPDELPTEFQSHLLNYKEMYKVIHRQPCLLDPPVSVFDEVQEAFININGISDGGHRHGF